MLTAHAIATIALGLLAVAGAAKVVDPEPTSGALRVARLPSGRPLVRGMGGMELAVAVAALVGFVPAVGAAMVAYLGFAGFTLWAVKVDRPIQSCGCFGSADTPPGIVHVVANAVSAGALAVLWVAGVGPVPRLGLGASALFLAFAGLGVFATFLLLSVLPRTLGAARP